MTHCLDADDTGTNVRHNGVWIGRFTSSEQHHPKDGSTAIASAHANHRIHQVLATIEDLSDVLMSKREPCVLKTSKKVYGVVWLVVLFLHGIVAVYHILVIWLYQYLVSHSMETTMAYVNENVMRLSTHTIICNFVGLAAHGFCIVVPILSTLWRREIAYTPGANFVFVKRTSIAPLGARPWGRSKPISRMIFAWGSLLGLESAYFDIVFHIFELVEIVCQVYQAWKLSFLVPAIWINRLYAIVIVLNCWSTPLLHKLYSKKKALCRVLCFALDMVFDLVTLTMIPVAIFVKYLNSFDTVNGDFPIEFYYDDTWLITAVAENQQIFVTSIPDLISKTIPGFSVLFCLISLRKVVKVAPADPRSHFVSVAPKPKRGVETTPGTLHAGSSTLNRLLSRAKLSRMFSVTLACSGLVVLITHLTATTVGNLGYGNVRGCQLEFRPWFSATYTCVVLEVNCRKAGHMGQATDIERTLLSLDASKLRGLIVSECPNLQVPAAVQTLTNLQLIKIYNSTIHEWPLNAALTNAATPSIQLLLIVNSNISRFPDGLMSDDFPPSLQDIEFCGTNLTTFPDNIHEKWRYIQYFVFENNPAVVEVPASLLRVQLPQLSLASNSIRFIPDYLFANQSFWSLTLSNNPTLSELPKDLGDLSVMYWLRLGYTNISSLPSWMLDPESGAGQLSIDDGLLVQLGGSPMCRGHEAGDLSIPTAAGITISCTTDAEWNPRHVYPFALEEQWRREAIY